jgi:hypothetical protein
MNRPFYSHRRRVSVWTLSLSLVGILLPCCIVGLIGAYVFYEQSAKFVLNRKLQDAKDLGLPIDNSTMMTWYEQRTSRDRSEEWRDIVLAANARRTQGGINELLDIRNEPELDDESYQRKLRDFIAEIRPLLNRIEHVSDLGKPIWVPMRFRGGSTIMDFESQCVFYLLRLQFKHDLLEQSPTGLIKTLATMQRCVSSTDYQIGTGQLWLRLSQLSTLYGCVQEGLEKNQWDAQQLRQVEEFLKPIDLAREWQMTVDSDRALLRSTPTHELARQRNLKLQSEMDTLFPWNSQLALWDAHTNARDLGSIGFERLIEYTKSMHERSDWVSLSEMGDWIVNHETNRRLVHAALDVRSFQRKNQRSPESFQELASESSALNRYRSCEGADFSMTHSFSEALNGHEVVLSSWKSPGIQNRATADKSEYTRLANTPRFYGSITLSPLEGD